MERVALSRSEPYGFTDELELGALKSSFAEGRGLVHRGEFEDTDHAMNQLQDFSAGSTGMEGFYVPTVVKVAVINHLFVPGAGRAQPTDSLSSKLGMFQTSYSVEKLVDTLSRARASGFEARTGPLALKSGHLGRRQAASVAWSGGLLVELYKPV